MGSQTCAEMGWVSKLLCAFFVAVVAVAVLLMLLLLLLLRNGVSITIIVPGCWRAVSVKTVDVRIKLK